MYYIYISYNSIMSKTKIWYFEGCIVGGTPKPVLAMLAAKSQPELPIHVCCFYPTRLWFDNGSIVYFKWHRATISLPHRTNFWGSSAKSGPPRFIHDRLTPDCALAWHMDRQRRHHMIDIIYYINNAFFININAANICMFISKCFKYLIAEDCTYDIYFYNIIFLCTIYII